MRVNTKNLLAFLNEASVKGIIENMKLRFTPEGLCITARDITNTGTVNAVLFKEKSFQDYKEMEVPISDVSRLMAMLALTDGLADLIIEGNYFRIVSDNFEGVIVMGKEEFLNCNSPPEKWPNLGYDEGFEIDAAIFDLVRKAIKEITKKDTKDESMKRIHAKVDSGLFTLQVGDDISDKAIAKADVAYGNVMADYGPTLLEFSSVMKGNINIAFRDNYPILITSKSDISKIMWLVAPILPDEEDEEAQ
jgi:hypothetical protein